VRLALLGNRQVQNVSDYALHFTGLTAGNTPVALPAGAQDAAQAVGTLFNLVKKGLQK